MVKQFNWVGSMAVALGIGLTSAVQADITFSHVIQGTPLDLSVAKKPNPDTVVIDDAFDQFKKTGSNPYNCNEQAIKQGVDMYLSACSGCHGHEAEGKLGPGLLDDYWTYPQNKTDKGLFESMFGGANGMMGPQYVNLSNDDMLQIMAWIRDIYTGKPKKAKWLKHKASSCPADTMAKLKAQAKKMKSKKSASH